jgi:sugar/nucleoside kinase (ribokinase family)
MLVAFNILLDDIVFPNGHTAMGVLGGGGPQTAFGMHLFHNDVGLVGEVGADLPEAARTWLDASGIDTTGVRHHTDRPSPRAWQVTETDGRRTQVWRVKPSRFLEFESIPTDYLSAKGFHFGIHPEMPPLAFAQALKRAGGIVSVEAFRGADQPPTPEALFAMLSMADIFSANLSEAHSLVGPGSARAVMRRLVEAAESRAMLMVLRLGEEGSLVAEGQTGQVVKVGAVPVEAIDAVGAGNAYCGGFLAGWIEQRNIGWAGACGAVAAGYAVGQVGLPPLTAALQSEAREKADALMATIDYTSL